MRYIMQRYEALREGKLETECEGNYTLGQLLTEFDYATKYLPRKLKVRGFVAYIWLFKQGFFIAGSREVNVRLGDIAKNLLSDLGTPMSGDVMKRAMRDLLKLRIVDKATVRPGRPNVYTIRLPSEIEFVKEMIQEDARHMDEVPVDENTLDYYNYPERRLKIFEREGGQCFYCLKPISKDVFRIDHIISRTKGGSDFRTNLVAACDDCNTAKQDRDVASFLLENYRAGLLTRGEFERQKARLEQIAERGV